MTFGKRASAPTASDNLATLPSMQDEPVGSVANNSAANNASADSALCDLAPESERPWQVFALPAIGDLVDDTYRITEEISRGAMGVVLGAFDEKLRRHVATKWIRSELLQPGFVRRFLSEAQAMARVAHPHVVHIHAFGQHREAPYFVMERIEGQTLSDWLEHPTPKSDAQGGNCPANVDAEIAVRLRMLDEICSGVEAIHAAGTVHRDLKPSNILLDSELRCHVADFGVSTLGHASESAHVGGTLGYMAPELVLSFGEHRAAEAVSDVYSIGCIAAELLSFGSPSSSQQRKVSGRRPKSQIEPSDLHPAVPLAVAKVIREALREDPAQRTPSVTALRLALKRASGGGPDRILIAEDDDDFRELLREALHIKFPTAEIDCVADGTAALASAEAHPAAIALVDLQMPSLDGAMLTRALRSRPETANMPIIVLSGSGGAAEWQRLSSFGADRFLVKPVHLDDVVAIIEHAMRERIRASSLAAGST